MGERTSYHHGNLRAALLAAAAALVREHGVEGVSLRRAAARAGVSHAAPYHHFADKAALVEALAVEVVQRFTATLERAWRTTEGPAYRRFGAIGVAYVRFALEHPSEFRVMNRPELRSAAGSGGPTPVETAALAAYDLLLAAIRGCQEEGSFAPGAPEGLAVTAWATVHGLALLVMDGLMPPGTGAEDPEALAVAVTRTLGIGLLRRDLEPDEQVDAGRPPPYPHG